MSRPLRLAIAAGVVVLLLAGGVLAVRRGGAAVVLDTPALPLDLARPDALVTTASLADLPRDFLTVPMFRDVLTEDVVTCYEQTEGRLSLAGTLRCPSPPSCPDHAGRAARSHLSSACPSGRGPFAIEVDGMTMP